MSMDRPNEYEQAIEAYAAAVRLATETKAIAERTAAAAEQAEQDRQESWRVVKRYINDDKIKPGVYRINKGPGMYAEALLLQKHGDYPDLLPMFR